MTTPPSGKFDFDVALSYAGEDRVYVQQIATLLQQRGVRIFYDEYAVAELWGNDLYVVLDEVYRKRARFAVVFVSRHYVSKPWAQHERQSIQARALTEVHPYLLPVRLDDSELPGLRPTIACLDARRTAVEELVCWIEDKLSMIPGMTSSELPSLRSPRTTEQQRELLALRPEGWEYLLYAGVLWQRRQALEPELRDHDLGYARRTRKYLRGREAITFVHNALNDVMACAPNIAKLLDPRTQEQAFGPPGQPGNPALIEHIATRVIGIYEEILDIAASIRGVGVSDDMAPLMEAAIRLTDRPLQELRDFIDQLVAETDTIPERLALDEPISITVRLSLTFEEEKINHFQEEAARALRRLRD